MDRNKLELLNFLGERDYYKWEKVRFDDSYADHKCQTLEDVNNFYKQDITYLHRQIAHMPTFIKDRKRIIMEVIKYWNKKDPYEDFNILDYGCGAGNLIIPLAQMEFNVSGVEIKNSEMSAFLRKRFMDRRLELKYYGHEDAINYGQNVVVCWDVLEHLTDVRGSLKKMYNCLLDGGLFVLSYGWHERKEYPPLYEAERTDKCVKDFLKKFKKIGNNYYIKK